MKRVVFLISLTCVLFSCKKEYSYEGGEYVPPTHPPSSTYFINTTIDGVPRNFTFGPTAQTVTGGGENALIFSAYSSADVINLDGITLTIHYTTVTPTTQSYDEYYTGDEYYITADYNPNSTTTAYTAGYGYPDSDNPVIITITSIAGNVISGIFNGNFYQSDIVNGEVGTTYPIARYIEGSFTLPLQ